MKIDQKGKPLFLHVGQEEPVFPCVSGLVDDRKRSFEDFSRAWNAASA